jgi:ABC-type Fe3+/spermidine/putrescine transport system ATPase subunit
MLEIRGLRKNWSDFSLDVSLSLESGAIGAILGPSGCGKSTLLRLIAGLEEADSGSISLGGRELRALSPEKRGIGMVFQDFALFPQLSVRKNIAYGPRVRGEERGETARRVDELAESFGIAPLLDRQPGSLSGGEQQRVALARALAVSPELVLLDEPLSSLDAGLRERLRTEIADRLKEAAVSALFVTHDVAEAFAVADRVFVMGSGRIVEEGTPRGLYERPRKAYTARFLGRGPLLPVLRVEGEGQGPIALTAFGGFRFSAGAPAGDSAAGKGGAFLHFPSDCCEPLGPGTPRGENELEGRVEAIYFLGRSQRIRLSLGEGALSLELDLDPRQGLERGQSLRLRLPPERCILISG